MKRKWLIIAVIFLLIGCQDNAVDTSNNGLLEATNNQSTDSAINDEMIDLIGTWTCVVDQEGSDDVFSMMFFDDMTFVTNDYLLLNKEDYVNQWLIGEWSIEEDKISLRFIKTIYERDDSLDDVMLEEQIVEQEHVIYAELNSDLKFDERVYSRHSTVNGFSNEKETMTGRWNRTHVHRSHGGDSRIIYQNDHYIYFAAELMYYAHSGYISGVAAFDDNTATYIHTDKTDDDEALTHIQFKFENDVIHVESNNNMGLPFGMNVYIDGTYTKDEPVYTNENALIETFETKARMDFMKGFLDDGNWPFLEMVIEYGSKYDNDEMTFSGFIPGLGSGADFLMTEDNKIYYLSYGEGPSNVFYTNDPMYRNKVPEFLMEKVRAPYDMKFVYNGEEKSSVDHYVWIREHDDKPESLLDDKTVVWIIDESHEYIEIYVKGDVENLSLVNLYYDRDTLRVEEILERTDTFSNGTLVIERGHLENESEEAIRFEDINGNIHYYYLREDATSDEESSVNQEIIRIPNEKTTETVDILKFNGDYLKVPILKNAASTLEAFVPNG